MKNVIYTSIVGDCDDLLQPTVVDNDFEYICFVEYGSELRKQIGVWKIMPIPYKCNDPRTLSRYPKMLPHKVLSGYDYSLWIDGNVTINDGRLYNIIKQKINSNVIYSGLKHWGNDCAYKECESCVNTGKASLISVLRTIFFLKQHHFKKHQGLYENNVILRKHNSSSVVKFCEMWWSLFLKYAKRDQLCHPYCYLKNHLTYDYLLQENFCSRNHPYFRYVIHKNKVINTGFSKLLFDIKRKSYVLIVRLFILLT